MKKDEWMKLSKLKWIIVLGALILSTVMLFIGSFIFLWGAYWFIGYWFRLPGLEWVFIIGGGYIILLGLYIASYLGRELKGRNLAVISLIHLIAAPSLIFLTFSMLDPDNIRVFMHPAILSHITLDVGLLFGNFTRRKTPQLRAR